MNVKKRDGSFLQRVALGVVCALIFSYTVYHLISLFGTDISTFAAGVTTETTTLHSSGYVFRDETVLTSPLSGVADYHVADGTKVSKDQPLATVYEDGTRAQRGELRSIEKQIAVLEQSTGEAIRGLDIGEVKQSVGESYGMLINMLASGEIGGLSHRVDGLLIHMNRLKELTGASTGEKQLEALRARREELLTAAGASEEYFAEKSGYFYSETDGYEELFTLEAARELTVESYARLTSGEGKRTDYGDVTPYGKLCTDVTWMLVLPVKMGEKDYFEIGETYDGLFEGNNQAEIPLTLTKIVEDGENGRALLVFEANRMPEHFRFDRMQNVRLEVDQVSGIYVPKSVIQRVDGYRGVYVLRGSVVYFRRIEIAYEGSDYYLVKEKTDNEGEYSYLRVNELIILHGKNLFDGRVLD